MLHSNIRHTSKNASAFMCVCRVCLKCVRDSEWVCNKSQIAHLSSSMVWTVFELLNVFFVCLYAKLAHLTTFFFLFKFRVAYAIKVQSENKVVRGCRTKKVLQPAKSQVLSFDNCVSQQGVRVAHKTPSVLYLSHYLSQIL